MCIHDGEQIKIFGGFLFLLGIVLPILFSSLISPWILVVVYVLSVCLIGVGVWLYLKEKK